MNEGVCSVLLWENNASVDVQKLEGIYLYLIPTTFDEMIFL